ncbi:MAG TPA: hypothetical protein VMF08_05500 [Candidatus Sulfotelmatobacter sp.]|nr:hypothetical protein [Candidatus Sulfotelmatobacter sp.]
MSKTEFEAVLNAKVEAAKEHSQKSVNWEDKKTLWLRALRDFYGLMDSWLSDYVQTGKIKVERAEVDIQEEHIGKYSAEMRVLKIGEEQIVFRPIGTLLVGARGRVDMEGPKGTVKFILTGKDSNGIRISVTIKGDKQTVPAPKPKTKNDRDFVWKIATPPPNVKFIELNSDSFFDSITEVLNA